MKTRGKVLLATLSAAMLVTASVMGTLAYLQDTDTVQNTFTVGQVGINLDESVTDANGNITTGRTETGNSYKLMPGHLYAKDPTITVDSTSENAWVFVKVDNDITAIEAKTDAEKAEGVDYVTIAEQMKANGWTDLGNGVYAYKEIVSANAKLFVFSEFMIDGSVNNTTLANYATTKDAEGNVTGNTIDVTAYAVQADGFATAKAAWDATYGKN